MHRKKYITIAILITLLISGIYLYLYFIATPLNWKVHVDANVASAYADQMLQDISNGGYELNVIDRVDIHKLDTEACSNVRNSEVYELEINSMIIGKSIRRYASKDAKLNLCFVHNGAEPIDISIN